MKNKMDSNAGNENDIDEKGRAAKNLDIATKADSRREIRNAIAFARG